MFEFDAITESSEAAPADLDALWRSLVAEAAALAAAEPALASHLEVRIRRHGNFGMALADLLATGMARAWPENTNLDRVFGDVIMGAPDLASAAGSDLIKLALVNPACPNALTGFLSFRGFLALQAYRVTHVLWKNNRREIAALIQNWCANSFAIDIHPGARIGRAVFIDHGVSVVIGETAVIGNDVSIWHGVTLGSTLTQSGDRHPKIGDRAVLCAGATLLGSIKVGADALVAAGSVVLKDVPAGTTVAGVPARVIRTTPARMLAIEPRRSPAVEP